MTSGPWEWKIISYESRFSALINSHVTLFLVWPEHESWENAHTDSRLSTFMQLLFSFDQYMRVEKTLLQTLVCQLSCNSHTTLVLVWPGHESWENSHTNSRLSTFMQLLFSFDQYMRVEKTLLQTLACQLSCNSFSRLTGHESWENSHVDSDLSSSFNTGALLRTCLKLKRNAKSRTIRSPHIPFLGGCWWGSGMYASPMMPPAKSWYVNKCAKQYSCQSFLLNS